MGSLSTFLMQHSAGRFISLSAQFEAAHRFELSLPEVEEQALMIGLLPERYRKNHGTISPDEQLRLFRSHVAVVGCGGLGGYIVEELARIGVGRLSVIDPDIFEEHNLNRQVLATIDTLNNPKVVAASDRVATINPAVTVSRLQSALSPENGQTLLSGAHAAVDGLDSIPSRLVLAKVCESMGIPLVHGSIAGWFGQVTTQFPGDRTLEMLYGENPPDRGVEQELGNPSFIPPLIASIETAEIVKVLLNTGSPLRHRLLAIDLLDMEIQEITIRE